MPGMNTTKKYKNDGFEIFLFCMFSLLTILLIVTVVTGVAK